MCMQEHVPGARVCVHTCARVCTTTTCTAVCVHYVRVCVLPSVQSRVLALLPTRRQDRQCHWRERGRVHSRRAEGGERHCCSLRSSPDRDAGNTGDESHPMCPSVRPSLPVHPRGLQDSRLVGDLDSLLWERACPTFPLHPLRVENGPGILRLPQPVTASALEKQTHPSRGSPSQLLSSVSS